MDQAKDTERVLRLRDNKRKHRQRQKEYVADLERRLAGARERGIQATKEVQTAAQKVCRENERLTSENQRLRQIIHAQGLDNDAINSLIHDGRTGCRATSPSKESSRPKKGYSDALQRSDSSIAIHTTPGSRSDVLVKANTELLPIPATETQKADRVPPCKLLTILADNPNADIMQVPKAADGQGDCTESDGVDCLQAREMLMRFATTESKLDDIASALEEGCVKNGSGRGCRVKNEVIWKALDRACE